MSRDDLALLVVRVLALLLGVYGVLLSVGALLESSRITTDAEIRSWAVAIGAVPMAAGVVLVAMAVPQAASWLAVRIALRRETASVLDPGGNWRELDQQAVALGGAVAARLILGVVLIAVSRRTALWTPEADEPLDEVSAD